MDVPHNRPRRAGRLAAAILLAAAGFLAGYLAHGGVAPAVPPTQQPATTPTAAEAAWWTCSMHPQVHLPEPGLCPICHMPLIRGDRGQEAGSARRVTLSERARALAEVETAPAARHPATVEVRLPGKVAFAEPLRQRIAARVPGRIERLFVDYTGMPVRAGDHLLELYSPQLIAAQEEFLQAARAGAQGAARLADAREKLILWGLTAVQLEELVRRGTPQERLVIHSPVAGLVVEKEVVEGQYVETGELLYAVADLSRVWIRLAAYEADLPWLRPYQEAQCTVEAWPGRIFPGRITFLGPTVDEETRTVEVRVEAPNPEGLLKPGMLARGVVRAAVDAAGRARAPDLAGRFVCPMHPETLTDSPGACPVCGMPLEPVAAPGAAPSAPPLLIPASAPLITGRRAVVYVESRPGEYEGREITLGPRAGDSYVVLGGLAEGERVVARGAFQLDSDLQLQARPSLMNPPTPTPAPAPGAAPEPSAAGRPASSPAGGGAASASAAPAAGRPQRNCPVMGGPIDRRYYADHEGRRIYFCCPGCLAPFRREPERYLRVLEEQGVVTETAPQEGEHGSGPGE